MITSDFKKTLIIAHDLVVTTLAVLATFVVRFEGSSWNERVAYLPVFLPVFVVYAGFVYWFCHLYRAK